MLEKKSFQFANKKKSKQVQKQHWKIMIVDDDEAIHLITKAVLRDFSFEGKGLNIISCYSGEEAQNAILEHPDTALMLLDVVMEEVDSGLTVARYIREEAKNHFTRIVLRTGQPGTAPEHEVILKYDLNGYKEKTELTAQKFFTTLITSLRNYRDLIELEQSRKIIEENRRGLEQIVYSSATLFEIHALEDFSNGVLTQLMALLSLNRDSMYMQIDGFTASTYVEGNCSIIAGTGKFSDSKGADVFQVLNPTEAKYLKKAIDAKDSVYTDKVYVGYFETQKGLINLLYVQGWDEISLSDRQLIQVFSTNVAVAFENIYLEKEIMDTQEEVVTTLGEVVEGRSKETANHVKRVGEFAYMLAKEYGLNEEEALILKRAAPMHDVGKIGISDNVLKKPGKLTTEEFEIMKTHAEIGYAILKKSSRPILKAAAIAAYQHHEKYNGKGYPQGLAGENIHIYGRITALADVLDALTSDRCYKKAWPMEKALDLIRSEKGEHFEPRLVDILMDNLEEVYRIKEEFADKFE